MTLELDIIMTENIIDIFLSDNIGGSGISIVGNNHKEVLEKLTHNIETYIYQLPYSINGCEVISRTDYESLPIPMCTKDVSNETMQKIANNIFTILVSYYGETDVIAYFNNDIEDKELFEDIDDDFYKVMEDVGLSNGIKYYN